MKKTASLLVVLAALFTMSSTFSRLWQLILAFSI